MSDFMRYCYVIVDKPELNTDECLFFKMIKGTSLHQTGTLSMISVHSSLASDVHGQITDLLCGECDTETFIGRVNISTFHLYNIITDLNHTSRLA